MNKRDEKVFKHLMERYKFQWDANQYYRTNHDENLEYYRGYRNSSDDPLVYNENFNRILSSPEKEKIWRELKQSRVCLTISLKH